MATASPPVAVPPGGESPSTQPPLDTDTAGMYYDVEAALLSTFRVDDTQLHTTWDEERRIIATVQLTRSVPSLSSLTHAFYRFWGQVCLARSEVRRDLGDDTISFRFQTSNGSLDYHGVVIFRGQPVQALLHRLHS